MNKMTLEISNNRKIIQLALIGLSTVAWQAIFVVMLAATGLFVTLPNYVYAFFSLAAMCLPMYWCYKKFGKLSDFGNVDDTAKWALIFFVIVFLVTWVRYQFVAPHFSLAFISAPVLVFEIIISPIIEETLYRGYLLQMLAKEINISTAIFLTALMNTLAHVVIYRELFSLSFVFLASLIFSFSYIKGKLNTAIIVHIFYNFLITIWA